MFKINLSDEEKQIAELCKIMHEETVFRALSYNPEKLISFLRLVDSSDNGLVIAYGNPVIGIFCGEAYPHIYTDDLVAVDQLMYVHPDHRRSGIASLLVEQYKQWAEKRGAKMVMIGSSTGFEGAEKFFQSKGFDRVGGNYGLR